MSARPLKTRWSSALLRLVLGGLLLLALAYYMWTPHNWPEKLFVWVLLTILADEFDGWFGYLGVLAAGLAFVSPHAPPAQWLIIVPLIGGSLFALLLVKHSGGPFVLPFAGAVYMLPMLAAARFGAKLDPTLTLPANEEFQRNATLAMLIGLGISLIRHIVQWALRVRERKTLSAVIPTAPLPETTEPLAQTRGWQGPEAAPVPTEMTEAPAEATTVQTTVVKTTQTK